MSRVEYRMSTEDLRTFDRWHARGAMVLAAVLLLMPWILGIGPNSVRPAAVHATTAGPPVVEAPRTAPAAAGSDAPAPPGARREPAAPATAPTPGASSGG